LSIPIGIAEPNGTLRVVLDKHNPLPQNGISRVQTTEDGQTSLNIDIFQGHSGPIASAEYLGTVQYRDLLAAPAGAHAVRLEMQIDDEGMLEIKAGHDEGPAKAITLSTIERPFIAERTDPQHVREPNPGESTSSRGGIRDLVKNLFR